MLIAVSGAVSAQILNRYFVISGGRPPAANNLISSIKETLPWAESSGNVYGQRKDVSPEHFCDFLSFSWPCQQKALLSLWSKYHSIQTGSKEKAVVLREILSLVEQYSGFT